METEDGAYEGFVLDLLRKMGLTFDIVSPGDNKYGKLDEATGQWSGMVGLVQQKVRFYANSFTCCVLSFRVHRYVHLMNAFTVRESGSLGEMELF